MSIPWSKKLASFSDGRLPGVTFKTSRWFGPVEMLRGLGLSVDGSAGSPVTRGDLLMAAPAGLTPPVVEDDDRAFHDALTVLGLEGWPLAEAPRLSRLWLPGVDGVWLLAGVMLESPEPIHRPGRLDVDAVSVRMGRLRPPIRFDIRRRDRSGSRLIYLTATPFEVLTREPRPPFRAIAPTLVIAATSRLLKSVHHLSGTLLLAAAPDFAKDP